MDAMPGKVELPEWSDCELACDEKRASALEEFVYEYEPSDGDGANEWRERLRRLLATSYGYADDAPNTRQRAERAVEALRLNGFIFKPTENRIGEAICIVSDVID